MWVEWEDRGGGGGGGGEGGAEKRSKRRKTQPEPHVDALGQRPVAVA